MEFLANIPALLALVLGLVFLVGGGELLVRGAAALALKANIPPLLIGLTVVSMGTSAPELFASVEAALEGHPGLAVGNVGVQRGQPRPHPRLDRPDSARHRGPHGPSPRHPP